MRNFLLGLGAFILLGVIGYVIFIQMNSRPRLTLKGIVASEKNHFLENPRVKAILKDKYGIVLDYRRAGSFEMVRDELSGGEDFVWPSSQIALEIFKKERQDLYKKSHLVFNSPIVLYSWDTVVAALVRAGVAKKEKEGHYAVSMPKLLRLIREGRKWEEIGLSELFGRIAVTSTDPTKSNSGNMFAGLVANVLSGDIADEADLRRVLPEIRSLFARQGYMQSSSGFLFEQYLKTGMGQYPLIAGYENQIIEFSIQNAELWPKVKGRLVVLYPVPTVWSEHPLITVTERAAVLIEALSDPEIQKIAWEQHGFRTGLIGIQNDTRVLDILGIPGTVTKTVPMPKAAVMEKMLNSLLSNE